MFNRLLLSGSSVVAIAAGVSLVALPSVAFGQAVSDRNLSDVHVDSVGGCSTLTINFNIRVQLISYFPQGNGRELHIRIKPLDVGSAISRRESLRVPASAPSVRSIEYESDNSSGPTLTLNFTRNMQFSVEAGAQPQTLVLRLNEPGAGQGCSAGLPGNTVPGLPAPVASGEAATAIAPDVPIPAGLYAVNVLSKPAQIGVLTKAQNAAIADRVVYESQFERDSQQWHRLRVGFYETLRQAEAAKAKLLTQFPQAWVVKVTAEERAQGVRSRIAIDSDLPSAPPPAASTSVAGTEADKAATAALIADSEQAIRDSNNDRAVQLLTNALAKPENENTPRALELLGLTRERKGQSAHAQAEYEEYLRRYPTGEGADRVRQRLAALKVPGGSGETRPALRAASGSGSAAAWTWGTRGSFSQFYFRDQGTTRTPDAQSQGVNTDIDRSVNLNQLLTTADLTLSGGNDRRQIQVRAAGSYSKNFGTSTTTIINNNTTFRSRPGEPLKSLTALYLDYSENDLNLNMRIGRQTRNSAGVLGRFDGGLVGWRANANLKFNVVAGYPVESSRQTYIDKSKWFYGASVDIGGRKSALQTTLYFFDQHTRGGFIDRRSVGVEARYLKSRFNAYTMLDYDVKFKRVNLALLTFNYNFVDGSNVSLSADYRLSPLLRTNNILSSGLTFNNLNQDTVTTLASLRPFFTDEQIYKGASDVTLVAKSLTATYSRPLSKKLQANLDFTLTDTGGYRGIAASSGTNEVLPMAGTGKEYYYGGQLVGSGMIWENDTYILGARYANSQNAKTYTADFNARIPITSNFRLSPRVRYAYQQSKLTASNPVPGTYRQLQPTMRLNYYPMRHAEIEVEVGANFATRNSVGFGGTLTPARETGLVISAGYRLDF